MLNNPCSSGITVGFFPWFPVFPAGQIAGRRRRIVAQSSSGSLDGRQQIVQTPEGMAASSLDVGHLTKPFTPGAVAPEANEEGVLEAAPSGTICWPIGHRWNDGVWGAKRSQNGALRAAPPALRTTGRDYRGGARQPRGIPGECRGMARVSGQDRR